MDSDTSGLPLPDQGV